MIDDCRFEAKQQERWLALTGNPNPPEFSPRFHSPSQAPKASGDAEFETEDLPGPSHFPTGADEDQYAAIGDAVHSYLAALPSMRSLSDDAKEVVAERCLSAFSVTGILAPSVLVSSGERFREWVEKNYPGAQWHVEIAASGPRAAGGDWNGTIDLVLQLPSGEVVVIDHKSAPIRRQHCAAKASAICGTTRCISRSADIGRRSRRISVDSFSTCRRCRKTCVADRERILIATANTSTWRIGTLESQYDTHHFYTEIRSTMLRVT